MRIAAKEVEPKIVVMPDTARPIRMRTGALTYMFTEAEAIELANNLVDAVDEITNHKGKATP
ncbi:hypothetical protein [Mycolicibacterium fortuitum]|jgi:hypothetical protein|uniref:hypothetical protein n=1 Tax=Mycolicibacterium fortuitum TaxID=1766 RepID=UPI003AAC40E3